MTTSFFIAFALAASAPDTLHKKLAPMPTTQQIQSIGEDGTFFSANPLTEWISALSETAPGDTPEQRELYTIQHLVPPKAGYFWLICNYATAHVIGGGAQQLLLREPAGANQQMLQLTLEAYKAYKSEKAAELLSKLIHKVKAWNAELENLKKRNAEESEYERIWSEIDSYDHTLEDALLNDGSLESMAEDLVKNPQDYLPKK